MNARLPWRWDAAVSVRTAAAVDRTAVADFLAGMDGEGLYERHFAHGDAPNLALLRRLEALDGRTRHASLAIDETGRVVGHAEYVAVESDAEYALMVAPGWRDRGVGRALLRALLDQATRAGLNSLHGLILATNTRAVMLARTMGFDISAGDDRRTVLVSRRLPARLPTQFPVADAPGMLLPETARHDPDRATLHRRPGA